MPDIRRELESRMPFNLIYKVLSHKVRKNDSM